MAMNFEQEYVGWNSTPPSTSRSLPSTNGSVIGFENSPPEATNQRQFAREEGSKKKQNDACFKCRKEGHWVKDCPMNSPNKRPPPSTTDDSPILYCHCGIPTVVRRSRTEKNPNRQFYTCPLPRSSGKHCNFFLWGDDINVKFISAPPCGCGAGQCRIYKETSGQDAGHSFFVCPIKKGQGACSFIKPVDSVNDSLDERLPDSKNDFLGDELLDATFDLLDVAKDFCDENPSSPTSTLTSCCNTSPSSRDMVEEGNVTQGMEIELPLVDTLEHPLVDSQGLEDVSDVPLQRQCKRLRHGDPKIDSFAIYPASDSWDTPQSKSIVPTVEKALPPSILTSGALIRRRQVKFLRQISSAGASSPGAPSYPSSSALCTSRELWKDNCLDSSAVYEILGFDFQGWYGRLVFPPSRSLTFPAPKPFFCGVFPCFDPISFPQDADIRSEPPSVESSKLSLLVPFQPSGASLSETSGLQPPPKNFQGIMKESVSERFKQAAASLQNELLSLLETMDYQDHASMLEESYCVFGALERLVDDYEPFKEEVLKFIGRAASLAQIELSMYIDDQSSKELFDSYNRKKLQLEEISHHQAETSSALEAANGHLQYLEQEASRLRDMLLHVEEELTFCKVEYMKIDTRSNRLDEDKMQSELNLQAALNEAEEAKKVCRQREAERNVAKASFDKAWSELRQSCNMISFM